MRVFFLPGSPSRGFGPVSAACGLLLCLAFAGCSKQGQGERCDPNNGDGDCETNLVCKGEGSLQGQTRGAGLCCPPVSDENTIEACRATATLPPEPDAGAVEETPAPVEPAAAPDAGSQPDASAPTP